MPQSLLALARVLEGLDPPPTESELRELLFARSKAELASVDAGGAHVEVTPDRLDLLSEGGLRQHLEGLLDRRTGLPPLPRHAATSPAASIQVHPSVAPLRPAIAAVTVHPPPGGGLEEGLLVEAVRFQELLHATLGLDRRSASLGIYPLVRVRPPVTYRLRPLEEVRFVPLGGEAETDGTRFFAEHPMAARYGALGRQGGECLVLEDEVGAILSLPPVLNARPAGEARVADGALLLESTGTRAARVEEAVGLMMLPFLARGYSVGPVPVAFPDRGETGERLVRVRDVALPRSTVEAIAGHSISEPELRLGFARARLGLRAAPEGYVIEVPPWRPDLLAACDLIEDLLDVRGLDAADRRGPAARTAGRRLPAHRSRRSAAEALLGLGFVPLLTTVLVPDGIVTELGEDAIALRHPVSLELARVRNRLKISLLASLARNTRYPYPQRFSEVGPVVERAAGSECGARTLTHAGFLIASEGTGLAEAAAIVDYLLRREQVRGVREPASLPGTIPGRAARVRLAGEVVAELGEIAPEAFAGHGVPVPVAWGEVDLSALAPLLGRTPTESPL
jgi:phenylalanyl-tRNA synthetase beta chain